MNTSPARTPFMDYETRKEIKGRKYVFQSQTKKKFLFERKPTIYFGPDLPNGADKQ